MPGKPLKVALLIKRGLLDFNILLVVIQLFFDQAEDFDKT